MTIAVARQGESGQQGSQQRPVWTLDLRDARNQAKGAARRTTAAADVRPPSRMGSGSGGTCARRAASLHPGVPLPACNVKRSSVEREQPRAVPARPSVTGWAIGRT